MANEEFRSRPETVTAAPPANAQKSASSGALREVVETLILAAIIFIGVRLVVLNFRVDGESMTPNLQDREMLLVDRNAYFHLPAAMVDSILPGDQTAGGPDWYLFGAPQRGDIIVFDPPVNSPKPYIKRIIGLPGDHVTFDNGSVMINDVALPEDYIQQKTRCQRDEYCDVVVPPGDIFVLGDNRGNSSDSRVFGPVSVDRIIGKAWVGYWPLDAIGFVPHYKYPDVPPPTPAAPTALAPRAAPSFAGLERWRDEAAAAS
ncbi:MAG TPA: signal peptidase I [Thermomicrobiales bacterium]|nr:signal peptidase I [Thermomicrobiales bacterium]